MAAATPTVRPNSRSALPIFPIKVSHEFPSDPDTKRVWAHPVARTLVLLWRPKHIINQHFWGEALAVGKRLAKKEPQTVDEARRCFSTMSQSNFTDHDLAHFLPEALPYLQGLKEVPFEMMEPL